MCERSSQNCPWRFECSNFTSKNVTYVVHVLVKRSKTFKNIRHLCSSWNEIQCSKVRSISNQGPSDPHLTTITGKLHRHLAWFRENWIIHKKKHCSRNLKNPKKFWKSEKNWNSRFQNFEKIDLIILPNRSNRSNRKKSLNRFDRFIGRRINTPEPDQFFDHFLRLGVAYPYSSDFALTTAWNTIRRRPPSKLAEWGTRTPKNLNCYLSRTLPWVVLPSRTASACTPRLAPVSYVQSCLLAACSQHDGWMSVAGRLGNHEVTSGGGHGRVDRVGS